MSAEPPQEPRRSWEPQQPYPRPPHQGPQPPPPAGGRTGFGSGLLAALVWVGVNVVLTVAIVGLPPSAEAAGTYMFGLIVPLLLAALLTWVIARRRPGGWPFWQLVLLALPFYMIFRIVVAGAGAAGP
ncbi:MAG: hypothetical protein GEU83_00935 [Pseudonocardiaceae bacterium]|nr:hypothetical protein [Pseudonocardiaceae bacterium]